MIEYPPDIRITGPYLALNLRSSDMTTARRPPPPPIRAPRMRRELDCRHASPRRPRLPHFARRPAAAVHLLARGGIRVLMSTGRRYEYTVGRLTLTWGAVPHLAEFLGAKNDLWIATFPLGMLLRIGLPAGFVRAVLRGDPIE